MYASKIAELMELHNLNKDQLARELGVNRKAVRNWLKKPDADIKGQNIKKICNVAPSHWNAKRAKAVQDLGITILYDSSEKSPSTTPMFASETFADAPSRTADEEDHAGYPRHRRADRRTFPLRIAYTGLVAEKFADATEQMEKMRIVGELYDGLSEQFHAQDTMRGLGNKSEIPIEQMPMFVKAMSYNELNIDGIETPTSEDLTGGYPHSVVSNDVPAWKMKILSNISITQSRNKVNDEMCYPDLVEKFADICRLWKIRLFEGAGMTFTVTAIGEHNIDTFQGVGTACGLDTAIEAYMLGVPIEDLTV